MFNSIRRMLEEEDSPLTGEVEIDETAWGGKPKASVTRGMTKQERKQWADRTKTTIVGMVERGGRVRVKVVSDRRQDTVHEVIEQHVRPDATIYTDEYPMYVGIGRDFAGHHRIKHKNRVYAEGHIHTQTIEGFFGNVKRGLSGVQHNVSRKWLETYVQEFAFKYNHRNDGEPMFRTFLRQVCSPSS